MAKNIMLQGTSSGVGKSIVTTGFCRIFKQMGQRPVPFKAQNMSSNSHALPDGTEMARSQVIQAYACGIEPHSDMNPILLKLAQGRFEAIINGKSQGLMTGAEYSARKQGLWASITEPYNRLAEKYDLVVVEGAGSPVEMNLKQDDLVNMGLAARINAPVILVSDIDRGGVFASVYGTLALFTEEERSHVKGIIINKCIGKMESFVEVKSMMEKITGLPVVGMIPYCKLDIEDEDSLVDARTGCKKIKSEMTETEYRKYMDNQFDLLAETLRANIDMDEICRIIGEWR